MIRLPVWKRSVARPALRVVREDDEAVILPFDRAPKSPFAQLRGSRRLASRHLAPAEAEARSTAPTVSRDPLWRARILHQNRCCPNCRRGGVIPLDLGDGNDDHRVMPVPGTSTLVGFYCSACGAEWAV